MQSRFVLSHSFGYKRTYSSLS